MLYTYRALDAQERQVLDLIATMRRELRYYVAQQPRRWNGLLTRMTRARAVRASNSIEGINVSAEDAIAAIDNEEPTEADKPTWQAVMGYHAAMDYILQRCRNDSFQFTEDVLLAVHFMICQHDLAANPGNFRPGWVGVRNSVTGDLVHEGVDRELLEPLVRELIDYMNAAADEPVAIRAAMTHLNLAMLHPFSDGNVRAARCLQAAVLANEGIVAPIFSSVEEYIGYNQQEYYDVLAKVGGGRWSPGRDCHPWIRFCLTGHYRQARTLLRRTQEIERIYEELQNEVRRHGLQDRTALALLEATTGLRVRNASYRVSADISKNLASRDLKLLVESGLLVAKGERRGRHYVAGDTVRGIKERHRLPKGVEDPFQNPDIIAQRSLFG